MKAQEPTAPVLALPRRSGAPLAPAVAEAPPLPAAALRVITAAALPAALPASFSPSEAARVLNAPGATVRSWQSRGLIPVDPAKLAGQHRYLSAIDVFYLAVLNQMLAAGLSGARAAAIARAVIYGEGELTEAEERETRIDIVSPTLERIRTCQRDCSAAAAHIRHRDERAPYWLLYEHNGSTVESTGTGEAEAPTAAIRTAAVVVPQSSNERRHAWQAEHYGCLNLTTLLARIERGLTTLCQQRRPPVRKSLHAQR